MKIEDLKKGRIYKHTFGNSISRMVYMGVWGKDIYNENEKGKKGGHIFCDTTLKGGMLIWLTKKDIENELISER